MSVVRQLAQAVLGLALLGHVVRLFATAVSDHQPAAMVTFTYYAALDLDDLATIYVERKTELLVCTDPADPGSTEQWSDYRYETVRRGFGSVEAATAAARHAAEGHLTCEADWPGLPPWESNS